MFFLVDTIRDFPIAAMFVGSTAAFLGMLYKYQGKLLYYPTPPGVPNGEEFVAFPSGPYDDLFVETEDGAVIHSWFVKQPDPKKVPTMIFFHGNAGNISYRAQNVDLLYQHCMCNVVIVDYRGYGKSSGTPSEEGLKYDALAVLDKVRSLEDVDPDKIFLFGRSLGGAVATYLAKERPEQFRGLIIENSFTSIIDMIDAVLPIFRPFKFLVNNRWESLKIIGSIKSPILFLSGKRDELVPAWMMKKLHDTATSSSSRVFREYPNGTHNDTWLAGGMAYYEHIRDFLWA